GQFRSDLLYRLNVITLRIPTLMQRVEDIPRLFTQLVNEACIRYRRDFPVIPATVLTVMANRDWPGNVRELRNAADRFALGLGLMDGAGDTQKSPESLAERVAEYELNAIVAELTANDGQLRQTYESLGLSRKTLYEKMQKYRLNRNEYSKE
ncbi:MAG: Fis family transcriptional regulator, partial [Sneathiella sp.]